MPTPPVSPSACGRPLFELQDGTVIPQPGSSGSKSRAGPLRGLRGRACGHEEIVVVAGVANVLVPAARLPPSAARCRTRSPLRVVSAAATVGSSLPSLLRPAGTAGDCSSRDRTRRRRDLIGSPNHLSHRRAAKENPPGAPADARARSVFADQRPVPPCRHCPFRQHPGVQRVRRARDRRHPGEG